MKKANVMAAALASDQKTKVHPISFSYMLKSNLSRSWREFLRDSEIGPKEFAVASDAYFKKHPNVRKYDVKKRMASTAMTMATVDIALEMFPKFKVKLENTPLIRNQLLRMVVGS